MTGFTAVPCAEPVAGIGCGGNLAIGAVAAVLAFAPPGWESPALTLPVALGIAERFDAYVRAPFDVVSTEGRQ